METREYVKADQPTFYFIGVTTGKSSIMKVFPEWAEFLGLGMWSSKESILNPRKKGDVRSVWIFDLEIAK